MGMEEVPPQGNESHEPVPIGDLIRPTLSEIERRQFEADADEVARDETLRAAVQRQDELRDAAAKDPMFADEYQRAIDRVAELLAQQEEPKNPNPQSDAPDN